MKSIIKTFFFFAAIPAIALAVSLGGLAKMNADLHSALAAQMPDTPRSVIQRFTIQDYLSKVDDPELDSLRRDVGLLGAMKIASALILGFSIVYMSLVKGFGAISRRSRNALLRLFRPAYYSTSVILALVTIVNAALLIGAIYFGESLLIQRVHVKLIFFIGAGALLGCAAVIKSLFESFKKGTMDLDAAVASEDSGVRRLVSSVSEEIGAERIENVVVGDAMTFFATEAPAQAGGKALRGKTIYLSRPLCRYLSVAELKSIVTHELGHFKGMDTEYSMKFYPIYRGLGLSIARLSERASGAMALALIPTQVMFNFLLEAFALSENEHSRERELAADTVAVAATDPLTFSTALLKTSALLERWAESVNKAGAAPPEEGDEKELAVKYFHEAGKSFPAESYERMLEGEAFHPFDSHPRVADRIVAAGQDPAKVIEAIDFFPEEKAASLL